MHKTTRALSKYHEETVAKTLRLHRTANSGATAFSKGDVVGKEMLIECKAKMSPCTSFTIQKGWIDGLEEERRGMGKSYKAIAISFNCGKDSYYLVDEKAMRLLVEMIEKEA